MHKKTEENGKASKNVFFKQRQRERQHFAKKGVNESATQKNYGTKTGWPICTDGHKAYE